MLRVKSDKRLITPVHLKTTIHLRQWWGGLNVGGGAWVGQGRIMGEMGTIVIEQQ